MYILPFMLFARFPRLGRRGQTKLVTSRDSPHVPTEPRLTFTRLFPHRTTPGFSLGIQHQTNTNSSVFIYFGFSEYRTAQPSMGSQPTRSLSS